MLLILRYKVVYDLESSLDFKVGKIEGGKVANTAVVVTAPACFGKENNWRPEVHCKRSLAARGQHSYLSTRTAARVTKHAAS